MSDAKWFYMNARALERQLARAAWNAADSYAFALGFRHPLSIHYARKAGRHYAEALRHG